MHSPMNIMTANITGFTEEHGGRSEEICMSPFCGRNVKLLSQRKLIIDMTESTQSLSEVVEFLDINHNKFHEDVRL